MSVLRDKATSTPTTASKSSYETDGWSSTFPGIWEMLSVEKFPTGLARETSTLMFFCQDGYVKLCLHDRQTGEVAWGSGRSVEEALLALEEGLQSGKLEWRVKKPMGKRR